MTTDPFSSNERIRRSYMRFITVAFFPCVGLLRLADALYPPLSAQGWEGAALFTGFILCAFAAMAALVATVAAYILLIALVVTAVAA